MATIVINSLDALENISNIVGKIISINFNSSEIIQNYDLFISKLKIFLININTPIKYIILNFSSFNNLKINTLLDIFNLNKNINIPFKLDLSNNSLITSISDIIYLSQLTNYFNIMLIDLTNTINEESLYFKLLLTLINSTTIIINNNNNYNYTNSITFTYNHNKIYEALDIFLYSEYDSNKQNPFFLILKSDLLNTQYIINGNNLIFNYNIDILIYIPKDTIIYIDGYNNPYNINNEELVYIFYKIILNVNNLNTIRLYIYYINITAYIINTIHKMLYIGSNIITHFDIFYSNITSNDLSKIFKNIILTNIEVITLQFNKNLLLNKQDIDILNKSINYISEAIDKPYIDLSNSLDNLSKEDILYLRDILSQKYNLFNFPEISNDQVTQVTSTTSFTNKTESNQQIAETNNNSNKLICTCSKLNNDSNNLDCTCMEEFKNIEKFKNTNKKNKKTIIIILLILLIILIYWY